MDFSLFISFDGDCKDAVEFYAKVFRSEVQGLMTFGQMPPDPSFTVPEEDKNKVMYSSMSIGGCTIMFCDTPTGMPFIKGNNMSPTIGSKDMDEIRRLFHALKEGGTVEMELQQTFWSDLFGVVTDQFGIGWQISHDSGKY